MIPKFGVYRFSIIRGILKCLSLLVALQIVFSNSQNPLQARYYTYFTEKATGLRSPMPNIVLFMAHFLQHFILKNFNHYIKLQECYSEHSYTNYLDSITDILLYLFYHLPIYSSDHHFYAFQSCKCCITFSTFYYKY